MEKRKIAQLFWTRWAVRHDWPDRTFRHWWETIIPWQMIGRGKGSHSRLENSRTIISFVWRTIPLEHESLCIIDRRLSNGLNEVLAVENVSRMKGSFSYWWRRAVSNTEQENWSLVRRCSIIDAQKRHSVSVEFSTWWHDLLFCRHCST